MAGLGSRIVAAFLCCLGVGLIIRPVSAIKCYHCNSNADSYCTEMFDQTGSDLEPVECNVFEGQYCIKTIGMYKGEVGTQRFCSSRNWGDVCEIVRRKGDIREYRSCLFTCTGDGCNAATSTVVNVKLLFAAAVTILALFLRL